MRVDKVNEQVLAALSRDDAARSQTPALRTVKEDLAGPQRLERDSRKNEGPEQQAARLDLSETVPQRPAATRVRIDRATERIVAQLVNENREVIRQIPPQELLDVVARIRRIQGLIFDESA
jgi:flagellar protein FlaG